MSAVQTFFISRNSMLEERNCVDTPKKARLTKIKTDSKISKGEEAADEV